MVAGKLGAMFGGRDPGQAIADEHDDIVFALDNGCFSDRWSESEWRLALERWRPLQHNCLFAVVPDVVGDAAATLARWQYWARLVKDLGYKAAFVSQDGLELADVPWGELDVFFVGGTTEWKLSAEAQIGSAEAQRRGIWTHMGRVNTQKRLQFAHRHGYRSCDGTFISFAPDRNLRLILKWLKQLEEPTFEL